MQLSGDEVGYTRAGERIWSLSLARLRIVGEYTTDAGHWFDDYFLVFIGTDPFQIFDASVEAKGTILTDLSDRLGTDLRFGLANRSGFSSRILWPDKLRDRPLFNFRKALPRQGWRRLLDWVAPRIDFDPSAEVRTQCELTG